jgi:hypothetical protein
MKTIILFFAAMCSVSLNMVMAQARETQNLYWVVESNVNHPQTSVIRFYTENEMVHELTIRGKKVDIRKSRHQRMLNKLLKKYLDTTSTVKKSKTKTSKLI